MRNFLKKDLTPYVIVAFLVVLLISIFFSLQQPLSYTVTVSDNPTVDIPVTVDFEVQKSMSNYSPESFAIELTHKYNSNDTYTFNLDPYDQGKYEFIFTPDYSGEYLAKITMKIDGTTQYFTETININQ